MIQIIKAGSRIRLFLGKETIWIRLHDMRAAPLRFNRILVDVAFLDSLNKDLPDFTIASFRHNGPTGIPFIKVAYYADRLRMRCPYSKPNAFFSILFNYMCTKHLIGMIIGTLMK